MRTIDAPEASTAHECLAGYRAALEAAGIDGEADLIRDGHHAAEMAEVAATWMLEIVQDPARFVRGPFRYVIRPTLMIRRTCGAVR